MGTKDFNALDIFIGRWRSRVAQPYVQRGDTVLDFGCGHQVMFLRSIQSRIKHGVGLDYDADFGQLAPNLEVRQFRFTDQFDFPNASFNVVSLLAVLEHIPVDKVDVLFREFSRVLAPGGQILITTPTPAAKPVLDFLAFKLHVISEPEIADHQHYYSRADLSALAGRHGLQFTAYRKFLFGFNCFTAFAKTSGSSPR